MSPKPAPLRLDSAACDGCGRCVPRCAPRVLRVGPGYISVDWRSCDGCGACAGVCDCGAIVLRSASVSKPAPGVPGHASPVAKPKTAAGASSWSLAEAALVLVSVFALYVGIQAIPGGMAHAPVWAGVVLLAYNAAIAGLLYFLVRRRGLRPMSALRFDVVPEWSSVALAIGLALGCWLVSVAYRAAAPLAGLQPPSTDGVNLATLFGPGPLGAALTVLVVAVVAPVLEEALLRGVVLGALRERFGIWPAVVASALAFSALHASVWSLVPLTVLGLALGWLAARSRSLWPSVIAHVFYNAVFVGAALYKAIGA